MLKDFDPSMDSSVPDPDTYVFGPSGSGSVIICMDPDPDPSINKQEIKKP